MPISCINFYSRPYRRQRNNPAAVKAIVTALALLAMGWVNTAFAQQAKPAVAPALPDELMFNSAPIDPLCFEAVSADEWLDVSSCANGDIVKLQGTPSAFFEGKIGYQYHFKNLPEVDAAEVNPAYSYYEYIGTWNGAPVILTHANGGGTGHFSSLLSIERTGAKIRVLQGFAAGDRCNGGIVDVALSDGSLHYGQSISPFDFLQMAEDNPADLRPIDDLDASAASCYGVARYKDNELSGVTLTPLAGGAAQSAYQRCFDDIYQAYLAQGKKDLSVAQLKEFTGEFNRVCITDNSNK